LPSQSPRYTATERLLCLSNGHGEDVIAVRVLQALQHLSNVPKLFALPLVGEGRAYQALGIPLIGPVKAMPSGGFIYLDGGRQLARDLQGGLLQLTLAQFSAIRHWAKQGGSILAVGDIVPLLLAYLSGVPYTFVGAAKSEYYLRDQTGALLPQAWLDGWSGSVYHPWERWLMNRSRCRAIFPRDTLTANYLQKWGIPAFDLGNPMMDGLEPKMMRSPLSNTIPVGAQQRSPESALRSLTVEADLSTQLQTDLRGVLLPGSRIPEAYENWQLILQAVNGLISAFPGQRITLLGAIAPNLSLEPLSYALTGWGWHAQPPSTQNSRSDFNLFPDPHALWFTQQQATLVLTQHAYADCLAMADWAIAMTGTGTEQFVGLGKPAITLVGKGPQFTPKFAEAQTRLLGESVTLVEKPAEVAIALKALMQNPTMLQHISENGRTRMGKPGAAERIAQCLMQQLAE